MSRRSTWIGGVVVSAAMLAGCQSSSPMRMAQDESWSHFGFDDTGAGRTVSLGAVQGDERNVVVEGTIVGVCQTKGCWMRVAEGEDELFVRFKDYAFFVPMNASGHRAVLKGTAESKIVPVDELRHYAEDAGKSPEEIAMITEPEERITFYADSVYIEGTGLDEPHSQ